MIVTASDAHKVSLAVLFLAMVVFGLRPDIRFLTPRVVPVFAPPTLPVFDASEKGVRTRASGAKRGSKPRRRKPAVSAGRTRRKNEASKTGSVFG
jgi:hypothetical protein